MSDAIHGSVRACVRSLLRGYDREARAAFLRELLEEAPPPRHQADPTHFARPLTNAQARVVRAIAAFVAEHHYPPTLRDIGRATGIGSTNGVSCHLRSIERKGYLTHEPEIARGWRLTEQATAWLATTTGAAS